MQKQRNQNGNRKAFTLHTTAKTRIAIAKIYALHANAKKKRKSIAKYHEKASRRCLGDILMITGM